LRGDQRWRFKARPRPAAFPTSTGVAGTTTASHLRPGSPGSLIFHRSGLPGGPTAIGRGEGSRRCSQAPAGQATTHLASPEPAPCCRGRRAEHPDPHHLEAIPSGQNRRPYRRLFARLPGNCRLRSAISIGLGSAGRGLCYARTWVRAVPVSSRLTSLARSPISSQKRRIPATGTLRCQGDSRRNRKYSHDRGCHARSMSHC
jgi:hypothetical protein